MLVSYELHAAAGLEYAKPWCWASQAAKQQQDCLGACVSVVPYTFLHHSPLGLALCNGSKSGVRPL